MKKLLAAIGAIGLVASSSTVVVSCNNDTVENDDITLVEGDVVTVSLSKKASEKTNATFSGKAIINVFGEEKSSLKISNLSETQDLQTILGSLEFHQLMHTKDYNKLILDTLKTKLDTIELKELDIQVIHSVKKTISNLEFSAVEGELKADFETNVKNLILNVNPFVGDSEYKIKYDEGVVDKDGKFIFTNDKDSKNPKKYIKIEASKDSKLITGQAQIEVKKADKDKK